MVGRDKLSSGELGLTVLAKSALATTKSTEHEAKLEAITADLEDLILDRELETDPRNLKPKQGARQCVMIKAKFILGLFALSHDPV